MSLHIKGNEHVMSLVKSMFGSHQPRLRVDGVLLQDDIDLGIAIQFILKTLTLFPKAVRRKTQQLDHIEKEQAETRAKLFEQRKKDLTEKWGFNSVNTFLS